MHKRFVLFTLCATAILAVSCAPSVSRSGDYGKISIAVGGPSVRGLETGWPGGTLPTFSSITVTVSASDMSTVTTTSSASAGNLTVQVPAGTNRLVEVMAVPVEGSVPYFAKAFAGSAIVDIGEGETKNVPITLALSKTKIVLPKLTESTFDIYSADSLTSGLDPNSHSAVSLDEYSDFEFDGYGRLFYTDPEMGLVRISSITDAGVGIVDSVAYEGLAYVASQGRLYYPNYGAFEYIDVASEEVDFIDTISDELAGLGSVIAADESAIYADGYLQSGDPVICRVSLNGTTITGILTASYDAIGLASESEDFYLEVRDMIVKDGVLYILAAQQDTGNVENYDYVYNAYSRGKVIAVSTSTLSKLWEAGWCGDVQYPTDANTQLYGPQKFVGIAPKKLYIADDGFYWNGLTGMSSQHWTNVSRVIELDLEKQAITATGLDGAVDFLDAYSANYVVYN